MERLSLKRLSAADLWGGLLYWGPGRYVYVKAPDMGISLHRGPFMSVENLESRAGGEGGGSYTGDFG